MSDRSKFTHGLERRSELLKEGHTSAPSNQGETAIMCALPSDRTAEEEKNKKKLERMQKPTEKKQLGLQKSRQKWDFELRLFTILPMMTLREC